MFSDTTIRSIEHMQIAGAIDLAMADGNLAAGHTMTVLVSGASSRFDASLETDGDYDITVADTPQRMTLIGGGGDDTVRGASMADLIVGGGGDDRLFTGNQSGVTDSDADTLIGGLGQDKMVAAAGGGGCRFVFQDIADSAVGASDLIVGLDKHHDIIDLTAIDADTTQDGDQAFHLVSAFTGHAGELTLHYDAGTKLTAVSADVDGDGAADMVIELKGDHSGFTGFAL